MRDRIVGATAAFSGGLAVILGAMAAHSLRDQLVATGHYESWQTAALYHLTHSIAALFLAHTGHRKCAWTMLAGILLFSGSIYVLSLVSGIQWLGPFTPMGGVLMIAAWFAVAATHLKTPRPGPPSHPLDGV